MKKTVVLLHGFAEDSTIWEKIAPALETDYDLLVPDLPGSGKAAADITGISMESMAEFVKTTVDKHTDNNVTLIGHSMGGYVSLAFAEKYPERLDGLGLFHSTAAADTEEKKETRKKNMEFIRRNGAEKFIDQAIPKLFSDVSKEEDEAMVREITARYRNFSDDSLVHYTEAMMKRPDRIDVLRSFPKPVLFIMGEYDNMIPLEQGLKQCSVPEFSYIYIATHSGHLGMLEEPEFCLNAIKDFLSGK